MTPNVSPTVTVFERSPDEGRGLARDMRVRWALEEVGQPYQVRPVSFAAMKESAHRALHPFGQISWIFAALSTAEPPIVDREVVLYLERDEPWFERRLRAVEDRIRVRLRDLSLRLGDADWLDGAFSAGDLMMVDVLRRLDGTGLLDEHPNLSTLVARAEARPAFRRAFDAQRAFFNAAAAV